MSTSSVERSPRCLERKQGPRRWDPAWRGRPERLVRPLVLLGLGGGSFLGGLSRRRHSAKKEAGPRCEPARKD
jgi:hypothetical protein